MKAHPENKQHVTQRVHATEQMDSLFKTNESQKYSTTECGQHMDG